MADIKGHGPKGMKIEVWNGLVDKWSRPEWKKKSDVGRSNRASVPNSLMHTGGSISFGEHKKRMAELKHSVSFRDVYDRVHKKKDGEYVSKHSMLILFVTRITITLSGMFRSFVTCCDDLGAYNTDANTNILSFLQSGTSLKERLTLGLSSHSDPGGMALLLQFS
ncbi:putative transposase, Ptta/En/Spm, plant [Sesbania bispinosa]|nr:putative transposase, Ptta/En/Spm, plant [Sesbania bispinosa]